MDVERRITYKMLDAWRGVACLWVLMLHSGTSGTPATWTHNPVYAFSLLGSLGVQLFFVISGFCIANAASSAFRKEAVCRKFVWARIRRIYPPYLVVAFFVLLWDLFKARGGRFDSNGLGHGFWFYLSSFTLTQIPLRQPVLVNVFWTLNYEIAFYAVVLVFLAIAVARKASFHLVMNLAHLCTIACLLILIAYPRNIIFPFNLWPQFGLGALVFDLLRRPTNRGTWAVAIVIGVVTAIYASRCSNEAPFAQTSMKVQTFVCLGFAVILVALYRADNAISANWLVKILMVAGTFSYSLYLTHPVVTSSIAKLDGHLPWLRGNFSVVFCTKILAAIVFGFAYYWCFERPFLSSGARHRQTIEQRAVGVVPVSI